MREKNIFEVSGWSILWSTIIGIGQGLLLIAVLYGLYLIFPNIGTAAKVVLAWLIDTGNWLVSFT